MWFYICSYGNKVNTDASLERVKCINANKKHEIKKF